MNTLQCHYLPSSSAAAAASLSVYSYAQVSYSQTPIYCHPELLPMKVYEQELPITQYFDLHHPRYKVKGKAIPLQAWTGLEGSRRLRLPDFKTFST